MGDATKGAGGGMSDCCHPSISAWQVDGTGESAGLWSCRECGHKFVPIAQLLAAADELERKTKALRDIAEIRCHADAICDCKRGIAKRALSALPGEPK